MEEGGGSIENTVLFGKYQLSRKIGQGRNGTVYLAVHKELMEYRAIKRVPKDSITYEQFKREALLLKDLRHPGIPIVYDLEEDFSYSYLIEEYLEGYTLYDVVKSHGHLSQEAVLRYGIQICSLVHYLHIAGSIPILYLDLQPKNLLLCHERMKLIDFDHAATLSEANEASKRYGTPGFCAPEQRDGCLPLDVTTDVYAIGCILHFMSTGIYPDREAAIGVLSKLEKPLADIIATCLRAEKEQRYQSAQQVRQALEGVFKKDNLSSLTIALIGSKSGVGTTHLAIGLSEYLNRIGYSNLYEEQNMTGAVRQMAYCTGAKADSYGIFSIRHIRMKPEYGPAARLTPHAYPIVLRDYGTDWERAVREEADVFLLIQGGKWWNSHHGQVAQKALKDREKSLLIYNQSCQSMNLLRPQFFPAENCFSMPFFADPFAPGKEACSCMEAILKTMKSTEKGGGKLRRFLRKSLRTICRKIGLQG